MSAPQCDMDCVCASAISAHHSKRRRFCLSSKIEPSAHFLEITLRKSVFHRVRRREPAEEVPEPGGCFFRLDLLKSELGKPLSGQASSRDDREHAPFAATLASPNAYPKGALEQPGKIKVSAWGLPLFDFRHPSCFIVAGGRLRDESAHLGIA